MKLLARRYAGKRHKWISQLAILLVLIPVGVILFRFLFPNSTINVINAWVVGEDSTIMAERYMQLHVPCLEGRHTDPNGIIALNGTRLAFTCHDDLTGDKVVVYDALRRGRLWDNGAEAVMQVVAVADGFAAVHGNGQAQFIGSNGSLVGSAFLPYPSGAALFPCLDGVCNAIGTRGLRGYRMLYHFRVQEIRPRYVFAVYSDVLVINEQQTLKIVRTDNEAELWRDSLPYQLSYDSFLRHENVLLVNYGNEHIIAYDILTGDRLWDRTGDFYSTPVAASGMILVYTSDHTIIGFDLTNGQVIGEIQLVRKDDGAYTSENAALVADGDLLAIAFRDLREVIVLRIGDAM